MNRLLVVCLALGAIACGRSGATAPPVILENQVAAKPVAPAPSAPASDAPRVVFLGDSLTYGLGLERNEAYPVLLQKKIKDAGYPFEVVNAGVSGDTTADGLRRLSWALDGNVAILVVALGANDGLRALPADQMQRNLQAIITRAKQRGIDVLLVGMEAPPNFGERYTSEFRKVFKDLAGQNHTAFLPFLLDGVAGVPELNQADGMHPTARGDERIAETLWPMLEKMIKARLRTR